MKSVFILQKRNILSLSYALIALVLVISMLLWPRATYDGARFGLEIWATVLVPSLLPFFIVVDILLNLGIVNMLGVLLEPIMRPLFNLPGSASFVIAMGFTSGFPMGAVVTRRLYEEKLCQASEAERLVAFTNNSSPLFILVAIAVGVFANPSLGLVLIVSHYLANILIGIILGLLSSRQKKSYPVGSENLLLKGLHTLLTAQKDRKPLGKLFGDAITHGLNTIALIGGFVVIYAVVIKLLFASGLMNYIRGFFALLLDIFNLNPNLGQAFSVGFFEITLGLKTVAQLQLSFPEQAVAASMILGWSGLCIQSQVVSVLAGSGIKSRLYIWGRIGQCFISGVLAYFLSQTAHLWGHYFILPAAAFPLPPAEITPYFTLSIGYTILASKLIMLVLATLLVAVLTVNLLLQVYRRLRPR